MTLKEMKQKTLRLIEEINPESELLTDDPDISAKINDVINKTVSIVYDGPEVHINTGILNV